MVNRSGKSHLMKVLKSIGVLSLILFLAVSCKTSNKDNKGMMENINRKWMLVEYKDFTKEDLTKLEANMDLTKKK